MISALESEPTYIMYPAAGAANSASHTSMQVSVGGAAGNQGPVTSGDSPFFTWNEPRFTYGSPRRPGGSVRQWCIRLVSLRLRQRWLGGTCSSRRRGPTRGGSALSSTASCAARTTWYREASKHAAGAATNSSSSSSGEHVDRVDVSQGRGQCRAAVRGKLCGMLCRSALFGHGFDAAHLSVVRKHTSACQLSVHAS